MIQLQSFLILALIVVLCLIVGYLLERTTVVLSEAIPAYQQYSLSADLSGRSLEPTSFSDNVLDKAREAIRRGMVTATADARVARVRSLKSTNTYTATLIVAEERREVLGGRCTCANGRKNDRSRCYHVAALELIFTGEEKLD